MPGELYAGVNAAICSVLFGFCAFSGPDAGIRRGMVRIAPAGASIWAELSWGQPLTCALQHSTWERAGCTDAQGPLPGIPPCSPPPPFVLPSLFYDDSAILHIAIPRGTVMHPTDKRSGDLPFGGSGDSRNGTG